METLGGRALKVLKAPGTGFYRRLLHHLVSGIHEDLLLKMKGGYSAGRPGGKRGEEASVYVESYGCTANQYDLEIMLAYLGEAGYRLSDSPDSADVLLVNTCGVKKPTEDRVLCRLHSLSRLGKPLVVAGCLPRINLPAIRRAAPGFSAVMDPRSVDRVLLAVGGPERREKNRVFFSEEPTVKPELPKVRVNRLVEIVQIAEGCTGSCSFCCVRFARGRLSSYPEETLLDQVGRAVKQGAREVWLTAQDTGAYGRDTGTDLAELLKGICGIEGKFLVRVGMMNPDHALGMLPRLIDAYRDRKVFKFLHLPVQSGDDEVLRLMNRPYSVEEFKTVVRSFRRKIPRITVATDVICGFPGEGDQAFERSLRLMEEVKPDVLNISQFHPRPGTPAERIDSLPQAEVKERSRRMTALFRRIREEGNRAWLGWRGEIIVDEKGKEGSWVGRNFAYRPVVVRSREELLGKFLEVEVREAFPTYLPAELV